MVGSRREYVLQKDAGEEGRRPSRGCHAKSAGVSPSTIIHVFQYEPRLASVKNLRLFD